MAVSEIADGLFIDGPGEEAAVLFYPGAKVGYTAYLPLFYGLAEQGVDCFLIKLPFNLAILGQNKAKDIMGSKKETAKPEFLQKRSKSRP